ncbi:hypothetical protein KC330_g185 [Hortaea werneckii]|nr:hypothetical protein KC330_g185 [Hortaea werneckii]
MTCQTLEVTVPVHGDEVRGAVAVARIVEVLQPREAHRRARHGRRAEQDALVLQGLDLAREQGHARVAVGQAPDHGHELELALVDAVCRRGLVVVVPCQVRVARVPDVGVLRVLLGVDVAQAALGGATSERTVLDRILSLSSSLSVVGRAAFCFLALTQADLPVEISNRSGWRRASPLSGSGAQASTWPSEPLKIKYTLRSRVRPTARSQSLAERDQLRRWPERVKPTSDYECDERSQKTDE